MDTSQKIVYKCSIFMKSCLTSLMVREMQIKTATEHYYAFTSGEGKVKAGKPGIGKDMEQIELFYIFGRSVN